MIEYVWLFDVNRRVYPPRVPGQAYSQGRPIWREHWAMHKVIGETSRSWLVGPARKPRKVPKAGGRGIAFTEAEIDRHAYVNDNAHRIGDRVSRLDDYELLQKIAALVGYKP